MVSEIVASNWRALIKPQRLEVDKKTHSEAYGEFVAKPLERGYGLTLGNALRRILLSSIQGAAVTSVKFEGVLHEFSTIDGVKEDVADIIMNIKALRIKLHDAHTALISLDYQGEGIVRASDIKCPHNIEIINSDQIIATLSGSSTLKMDMTVELGKGYKLADQNKDEHDAVGVIPIDANFSPIRKVSYRVTNARVGQSTDFDKLTMEILTDGSVRPEDALAYSSKILKEQLSLFVNFVEEPEPIYEEIHDESQPFNENLNRRVEELELSVRSANCLQNANIKYLGELVGRSENEMLRTKNFGRKSLNEIKEILSEMGLHLGMKIDGWTMPKNSPAPTNEN